MNSWPKIFFLFALAFMAGIFLASGWKVPVGAEILLIPVGLALFLTARLRPLEMRKTYILTGFLLVSVALGAVRYNQVSDSANSSLEDQAGRKVAVTGTVVAEPDERDKETRLVILPTGYSFPTPHDASSRQSKILVTTTRYPVFQYGDQVKLAGKLQRPKNFTTAAGTTFDYVSYLAKDDIRYEMYLPKVTLLASGGGSWLTRQMLSIKKIFLDSIARALPEPEASYLAGLLLGAKRGLGEAITADFQRAGLSHVLVLSGYNVTIVASSVAKVLSIFLSPFFSGLLSMLIVLLFGVAAGGGATVWRACAMAVIAVYGKLSGRLYNVSTALLLAASLLLWFNPRLLFFDLSFQLSFLATLGVVYGAKIFQSWFKKVPERYQLKDTLCTTLGALVFVLPIILYNTGLLAVFALPANLLILPLVPFTMFLGFWTVVINLLSAGWLAPLSYAVYLLLKLELAVVHFVAALPFSAVAVPTLSFWFVSFIYLILAATVWMVYQRPAGAA